MNRLSSFVAAGSLAIVVCIGCEKTDSTPAVPANPPAVQPQATGTISAGSMSASGTVSMPTGSMAASASTADAQKLLDQATQYIKENKWDLADSTLKQLEAMKATLPADWAPRVDQARTAFNAAKGGSNMMPSMPAMPK